MSEAKKTSTKTTTPDVASTNDVAELKQMVQQLTGCVSALVQAVASDHQKTTNLNVLPPDPADMRAERQRRLREKFAELEQAKREALAELRAGDKHFAVRIFYAEDPNRVLNPREVVGARDELEAEKKYRDYFGIDDINTNSAILEVAALSPGNASAELAELAAKESANAAAEPELDLAKA